MQADPYSPGALPSYLAGRADDLERVRAALGKVGTFGRSAGPLVAFHGPRGVGKTSLLRTAQREAIGAEFLTAWVTGRADEPLLPQLAATLRTALADAGLNEPGGQLSKRLEQVQVELGLPGAKVTADLRGTPAPRPPDIETLLRDTARFAREHARLGLVLFVDELQETALADRRSLLIALQHFDGDPTASPVAVVGAGLPSLPSAITDAATFGERSRFVELGALTAAAAAEALRLPADGLGVAWSDEALQIAVTEAAGYPYKVQLLGSAAWAAASPRSGGATITAAHARDAVNDVEQQMRTMFVTRYHRATSEERRLLRGLAAVATGDVAVRSEAETHLGVGAAATSRARQQLIGKGLIDAPARGRLRFTLPGFGEFLRQVEDD